jgi:hypothetical protein
MAFFLFVTRRLLVSLSGPTSKQTRSAQLKKSEGKSTSDKEIECCIEVGADYSCLDLYCPTLEDEDDQGQEPECVF